MPRAQSSGVRNHRFLEAGGGGRFRGPRGHLCGCGCGPEGLLLEWGHGSEGVSGDDVHISKFAYLKSIENNENIERNSSLPTNAEKFFALFLGWADQEWGPWIQNCRCILLWPSREIIIQESWFRPACCYKETQYHQFWYWHHLEKFRRVRPEDFISSWESPGIPGSLEVAATATAAL